MPTMKEAEKTVSTSVQQPVQKLKGRGINMKRIDKVLAMEIATTILTAEKKDYMSVRHVLKDYDVTPTTQIAAEAFPIMAKLAKWTYSPADKGRNGKHVEAVKRIRLKFDCGASFTYWHEFFAHKATEKDIIDSDNKINYESKTSVGDFNRCQYGTLEQMRKAYERKTNDLLDWDYPSAKLHVICTWKEFFQYLEGYNDKGLATWYKSNVKLTNHGYIFSLQEIKTSKKKLAYLQAWDLNTYGK